VTGFSEYLRRLSRINPLDYQDQGTQAHLAALAGVLDDLAAEAKAVMLARLIAYAPDDALELTGHERGLQRYPGEYPDAFRNRLLHAWEFWDRAGTLPGMLAALEHMGYGVRIGMLTGDVAEGVFSAVTGGVILTQAGGGEVTSSSRTYTVDGQTYTLPTLIVPDDYRYYSYPPTRIVEHYQADPSIWAEFSLYLTPTEASFNADAWDDGSRWDDGSLWDLTLTQAEIDRVRSVIDQIKPAHARLRGIYLVSQFITDYWDDGSPWDDGSVWDTNHPTTLYLRPGV